MHRLHDRIQSLGASLAEIERDELLLQTFQNVARRCIESLRGGGKILLCGNGGSAADAQHLAAELSGRFARYREPLHAEALHVNTSYLTAVANDYEYHEVYARLVRAMGRSGDVLIGISTSGNSENVVRALEQARLRSMITVAFTGRRSGRIAKFADYVLAVPADETPRIQECHIHLGHTLCELIEEGCFPAEGDRVL